MANPNVVRLKVFVIHDDPGLHCIDEERDWMAIAAENEHDAIVIAAATYDGEAPRIDWDWRVAFVVHLEIVHDKWPNRLRPYHPERLDDCETLRLCGFGEEGEFRCDDCNLYANGMKHYAVCHNCCYCRDCGCMCEDEAENSEE